jgi:hypothetical protein
MIEVDEQPQGRAVLGLPEKLDRRDLSSNPVNDPVGQPNPIGSVG